MSRTNVSRINQTLAAVALAAAGSGNALADDNSMNPFTGDAYVYFNSAQNAGASSLRARSASDPTWRLTHPDGSTERELQALSSSGLPASPWQIEPGAVGLVAADAHAWRDARLHGATETELQALSSSGMSPAWALPAASAGTAVARIESPTGPARAQVTAAARLARFFQAAVEGAAHRSSRALVE